MSKSADIPTLVGQPYAPNCRGEDVLCTFRGLPAVATHPVLSDIHGHVAPDAETGREFGPHLVKQLRGLTVFHINGDKIEQALNHLKHRREPVWT